MSSQSTIIQILCFRSHGVNAVNIRRETVRGKVTNCRSITASSVRRLALAVEKRPEPIRPFTSAVGWEWIRFYDYTLRSVLDEKISGLAHLYMSVP